MSDVALRPGVVLDDRFVLERQLGQGGCGVVWLAKEGGNEVVLKILHPHFDKNSNAIRQLEREASLLEQLAHPNIAKPFALFTQGAHSYLAMEYVDGRPLDQEMGALTRDGRQFEIQEIIRLFRELSSAVQHAHSRTIVHRDLKPQNVMVVRRGRSLFVKVLDFGIAKLLEGNAFDATTYGRRLGSMFYMSPEQCDGQPADVRSDVFALGTLLFELLTLRRAWAWDPAGISLPAYLAPIPADGANSLGGVLLRIGTAPRPLPSRFRPELPVELDRITTKAMAIEREDRFPTVEAMSAAFLNAVDDLGRGATRTIAQVEGLRASAPFGSGPDAKTMIAAPEVAGTYASLSQMGEPSSSYPTIAPGEEGTISNDSFGADNDRTTPEAERSRIAPSPEVASTTSDDASSSLPRSVGIEPGSSQDFSFESSQPTLAQAPAVDADATKPPDDPLFGTSVTPIVVEPAARPPSRNYDVDFAAADPADGGPRWVWFAIVVAGVLFGVAVVLLVQW